jgi:signal transduction histidine kinase
MLPFAILVAHAIIRLRLMELRLFISRGLTIAAATLMSLVPVGIFLVIAWSRISTELGGDELVIVLGSIMVATLLVPPTRDVAERVFDRYVYRTHASFRRVVLEASGVLTRVLDLRELLAFVAHTVRTCTAADGAAVYLLREGRFHCASIGPGRSVRFAAPEIMPALVANAIDSAGDCLVADEVLRRNDTESGRRLHKTLVQMHWALLVPVIAESAIIGAVVLGPKRSSDAFYPHDMDLLMTLANQAGIAIKNAQLYTEVLLANEYIQNIVETIESGVVAVNASDRVTMYNRAAEHLVGLAAIGVLGGRADVLPVPLTTLLAATVNDGIPRTQPEIALTVNQVIRPVMCTTSPLRDPTGLPVGAVAVFSDLSPVKELEHERRRGEQLAQFEALASSIAHEIKNPLVAIKAFAQLIPRRLQDERFVGEFSRVVTREIGRIEQLVDRLRMLSSGPGERPRHRIDLRVSLLEAVEFLKPSFEERRIALEADLGSQPSLVLGDHAELEALFVNLLINGQEATPSGGVVRVVLRVEGETVMVSVSDSGPGIPPEHLGRIFDPFFTTKASGSGLGLTICAGIAKGHRAKLRAVNEPGGGAVFTLEIPAALIADPAPDEVKIGR